MKKVTILIISFNLITEGIYAGMGKSILPILRIPQTARVGAIAGASLGVDDIDGMNNNPAVLAELSKLQPKITYWKGYIGNFGAYLVGIPKTKNKYGLSIVYFDTGEIEVLTYRGEEMTNRAKDMCITLGWAKNLAEFLSFGLNIKYIVSELVGYKVKGFALDTGIISKISSNFKLGISILNIGQQLKYLNKEENLPFMIRPSLSFKLKNFTFCADTIYLIYEEEFIPLLGVEYLLKSTKSFNFALRTGYDFKKGLSAGTGISYKNLSFDYAITVEKDLPITHRITISIRYK